MLPDNARTETKGFSMCVSECLYVWGEGERNGAEVREQGIQVVSSTTELRIKED